LNALANSSIDVGVVFSDPFRIASSLQHPG